MISTVLNALLGSQPYMRAVALGAAAVFWMWLDARLGVVEQHLANMDTTKLAETEYEANRQQALDRLFDYRDYITERLANNDQRLTAIDQNIGKIVDRLNQLQRDIDRHSGRRDGGEP